MRSLRSLMAASATALLLLSMANQGVFADPELDPNADYMTGIDKDLAALANWPADVDIVYGFEWKAADYSQLAGFSQTALTEVASDAYWKNDVGYACFITRTVEMESDPGAKLKVTITACRNYKAARSRLLGRYALVGLRSDDTHGSSYGLTLGDVSVIRDVPNDPEGFEGSQSNNLVFIRGNLLVECVLTESDPPSAGFTAAGLAASIDATILAQRQACGGDYPKPTATVEIANPNGDLRTLPAGERSITSDVTVATTHPGDKPVKTKVFVARWIEPEVLDADGIWQPDPTREPVWRIQYDCETLFVDNADSPTTLTMEQSHEQGNWQLIIVAWGPNLVPVFTTDDFSITPKP